MGEYLLPLKLFYMKKIVFIKDFATRKKGFVWECSGMLARDLIKRGVAELYNEKPKKERKPKLEDE